MRSVFSRIAKMLTIMKLIASTGVIRPSAERIIPTMLKSTATVTLPFRVR